MPIELPDKVRPFADLGFDGDSAKATGDQVYGTCPFCGKVDKFYIKSDTGQYSCKSGHCMVEGNIFTYLRAWYQHIAIEPDNDKWTRLSIDRSIPIDVLKDAGIKWWQDKWYIPVHNPAGEIVNYRVYRFGGKLMGLPTLDSMIWNIPDLYDGSKKGEVVYVCEGEWDGISLREIIRRDGTDGVIVAVPGAAMFKDLWVPPFSGRDIVACYDNDIDGRKGVDRAYKKLDGSFRSFAWVQWPSAVPDKFDMRDFYKTGGNYESLMAMVGRYEVEKPQAGKDVAKSEHDTRPMLSSGKRPTFEETLDVYKAHLYITPELEWMLRIIYAVVMACQIEGDPLWIHIASVPGSGKTELLRSVEDCMAVHFESSLTPHSLVSGWQGKGGDDPSLIPRLTGKCLVLKDFTEVLQMNRGGRDEIYAVLRGAYDGSVRKSYGNGLVREYKAHFNIVTGVTHAIFGESGTTLGERFLIYHQIKGVGFDADRQILAALENVTGDDGMRKILSDAATAFLDYKIDRKDIPQLTPDWTKRLVGLAQFVAMLRASVPKSFSGDRLQYRAQHEMGTRIAKQVKKLLLGLSLLRYPAEITEDDYRLAVRICMDSCNGFNLEIVCSLFERDGKTAEELSVDCRIPISTLREHLDDLHLLGVLNKVRDEPDGPGRPQFRWWVTEVIEKHWARAKLFDAILKEDIGAIAKKIKEVSVEMNIKRAGSGSTRSEVNEDSD